MRISVVIPAHNPHARRLARVFAGLAAQTLPAAEWETLLIDNASTPPISLESLPRERPAHLRLLAERSLGLTAARRCGFRAGRAEFCVLVDDDNVLAPTYLADVSRILSANAQLGAVGGPSRPEFEMPAPEWAREFFPLLALRDLGSEAIVGGLERAADGPHFAYPVCSPIGAGMAVRRAAITAWLNSDCSTTLTDRRGSSLSSGGDNDIALAILQAGWKVGYFPELSLTHLIPPSRLDPDYLARLNRGIQASWMEVLSCHAANPWPPLTRFGAAARKAKAWFTYRPWTGPAARVRYAGACGHFDGRAHPVRGETTALR